MSEVGQRERLTQQQVLRFFKDQLAADKATGNDGHREVRLFANLCEESPAIIEELDLADYRQLQETYSGFLS